MDLTSLDLTSLHREVYTITSEIRSESFNQDSSCGPKGARIERYNVASASSYLGVPSVLDRGVRSMIPPSAWHTQVSSRPEAGEHLVPGGPSPVTDLSKRLWKHSKTKLSSMT